MTIDELYEFMHTWIFTVVGTELGNDENKIIRTNENAPRPAVPYIAMQYPPIDDFKIGEGNYTDPDENGVVTYATGFNASMSLQEIGGDGSLLRKLERTINQQDILDLFYLNNVSLITNNGKRDITTDTGDNYIEIRTMWDFVLSYVETDSYTPGYIKTIEIEGDVDGNELYQKIDIETQEVIE